MKFTAVQRLEIVATMCDPGSPPEGLNGWTYELLCEKLKADGIVDISRGHLCRILERAELRPHKTRMWLHSKDPDFKEKVADIVELYLHPPEGATVICFDEKTGMQAIERKYPDKPATPAIPGPALLGPAVLVPAAVGTECPTAFESVSTIDSAVAVIEPVKAMDFIPPVEPEAGSESTPAVGPLVATESTPPVETATGSESTPSSEALATTGFTPSNAPATTADLSTSAKASAPAIPRSHRSLPGLAGPANPASVNTSTSGTALCRYWPPSLCIRARSSLRWGRRGKQRICWPSWNTSPPRSRERST